MAAEWAAWHERVLQAVPAARARLADIDAELGRIDTTGVPTPDVSRWAEVEA